MARFLVIVITVLTMLVSPITARSEIREGTTADLYRLYKIKDVPSAEEEKEALDYLMITFNKLENKVAKEEMLRTAQEDCTIKLSALLQTYDQEIYELQEDLDLAEKLLKESGEDSIDVMLRKDIIYRSIVKDLDKKTESRALMLKQLSAPIEDLGKLELDKKKLSEVAIDVNKSLDNYNRALSYSRLGKVGNNDYPLLSSTKISSSFGWRLDPINKEYMQYHRGIDLRAYANTFVLAQFNGVVEKAEYTVDGGNMLILNHGDGVRTVYMHLSSFLVAVGDSVSQNQKVALSGNTGSRTTGAHLHFGLYIGGEYLDPAVLYN